MAGWCTPIVSDESVTRFYRVLWFLLFHTCIIGEVLIRLVIYMQTHFRLLHSQPQFHFFREARRKYVDNRLSSFFTAYWWSHFQLNHWISITFCGIWLLKSGAFWPSTVAYIGRLFIVTNCWTFVRRNLCDLKFHFDCDEFEMRIMSSRCNDTNCSPHSVKLWILFQLST